LVCQELFRFKPTQRSICRSAPAPIKRPDRRRAAVFIAALRHGHWLGNGLKFGQSLLLVATRSWQEAVLCSLPAVAESGSTVAALALCETPRGLAARIRHAPELEISHHGSSGIVRSRPSQSTSPSLRRSTGPTLPPVLMALHAARTRTISCISALVRVRGQDGVLRGPLVFAGDGLATLSTRKKKRKKNKDSQQ